MQPVTQDLLTSVVTELDKAGRLNDVDVGALAILANAYNESLMINEQFITGKARYLVNGKRNPLITIAAQREAIALSIMREFGLTAKSRKVLTERVDGATASNRTSTQLELFADNDCRGDC